MSGDISIGAMTTQSQFSQGEFSQMFGMPTIVLALISFKVAPLLFYFYANFFTSSLIMQLLIIFTLLSIDHWIVKNIRLLIGLRWCNFVDDDGSDNWNFKSAKDITQFPAIDKRVFWIGLVVGPAAWTFFVVTAFLSLKFDWMIIALLGALMNLVALCGYLSCHRNHTEEQTTSDGETTMNPLEACTDNLKGRFAQDRKALLLFIQYEAAQGKTVDDAYRCFRHAFGENCMKFLDFDFWFYRFVNGHVDLNHVRSKDPMARLSDMPPELIMKIIGNLEWKDRSAVRNVSRKLRDVVENSKQYFDKLSLIIDIGKCTLEVKKQKYSCRINYDHPFPDARTMMALNNLFLILKFPKNEIRKLFIYFYDGDEHVVDQFTGALKNALRNLNHKISVKSLELNVTFQDDVLAVILPYLKPVVLEEIDVLHRGSEYSMNIDDIVEMDQWKKTSIKRVQYVACRRVDTLFDLTDFDVEIPIITTDDFVRMKETLRASAKFESGHLRITDRASAESIRNELGNRNVRFDDGFTIRFENGANHFYFFKKNRDFRSFFS